MILNVINVEQALDKHRGNCVGAVKQLIIAETSLGIKHCHAVHENSIDEAGTFIEHVRNNAINRAFYVSVPSDSKVRIW